MYGFAKSVWSWNFVEKSGKKFMNGLKIIYINSIIKILTIWKPKIIRRWYLPLIYFANYLTQTNMQNILEKISLWLKQHELSLNYSKSVCLFLNERQLILIFLLYSKMKKWSVTCWWEGYIWMKNSQK